MNKTNILNEKTKYIIMMSNSNKQHKDINDLNGLLINLSGKYWRDELSDILYVWRKLTLHSIYLKIFWIIYNIIFKRLIMYV